VAASHIQGKQPDKNQFYIIHQLYFFCKKSKKLCHDCLNKKQSFFFNLAVHGKQDHIPYASFAFPIDGTAQ